MKPGELADVLALGQIIGVALVLVFLLLAWLLGAI